MMDDLETILDQARAAGASIAQLEDLAAAYKKKNPGKSTGTTSTSPSGNVSQNGIPALIAAPQSSAPESTTSTLAQGAADLNTINQGQIPTDQQLPGATLNPPKASNTSNDQDNEDDNSAYNSKSRNAIEQGGVPSDFQAPGQDDDNAPTTKPGYGATHIAGAIDAAFAPIARSAAGFFTALNAINNIGQPEQFKQKSSLGADVFNWAADYLEKLGNDAPLPNTFGGQVVKGVTQAAPMAMAAYATGGGSLEGNVAEAMTPELTKTAMLQQALTKAAGPLTQYMAVTKSLENVDNAYRSSGGDLGKTLEAGAQGFTEGAVSGVTLELQMAAGGQIGEGLFKQALNAGIVNEDGVLTQQALKSFIGSPVAFAAGSVAQNLADGQPIDWKNAGVAAATALPFEASHVYEAYNQSADIKANKNELNVAVNKAIQVRDNNAIMNFSQAAPEDIFNAMQVPETSQELQLQAIQKGIEAQNTDAYREKNALYAQQLDLQKKSDIKRLGEVVIQQGVNGFIEAVNHTELPDETKSTLLNNANAINAVYNPVELQKTDIGKNIASLNDQIAQIHLQPTEGVEPGVISDNLIQLNDLTGQKVKAQSDLFDLSYKDNEQQKEGVAIANKVAEEPVTVPEPAPVEKASVPINSDFLPDSKLSDVHDGGDVSITDADGNTERINDEQRKALGVTDEHIQQYKDANGIKDTIPVAEATPLDTSDPHEGESEYAHKLRTVTDPSELAKMYTDKVNDLETNVTPEGAIANYRGRIKPEDFYEHNDKNKVNRSIALNYFTKKGESSLPIDTQAGEINGIHFNGTETIQPSDITDFMEKYPAGHQSFFTPAGNEELKAINDRYRELTGKNLRKDIAKSLAEKYGVDTGLAHADAERINSPKTDKVVEGRIDDLVHRDGLFNGLPDPERLHEEFEKYIADPTNEFNIFHEAFDGEKPNEHDIELTKKIIDGRTTKEGNGEGAGEEHSTGSSDSAPEPAAQDQGQRGPDGIGADETRGEGNGQEIADTAASGSTGTPEGRIDPETQGKIKSAMDHLFPGIETHYYDNVEDFNKAVKENGVMDTMQDGTTIHAFVGPDRSIHFNPDYMESDTQIHEQGHILTNWAYHYAPKLFERMMDAGRVLGNVHKELADNGYKLKGNHLYEEAFVTAIGRDAAGKLDEILKGPEQRSSLSRLIHEAWTKLERWVAGRTGFALSKFKNIQDMNFDEFSKYINEKYLGSHVKISDVTSDELKNKNADVSTQASATSDRPVRHAGESLGDYANRVAEWTHNKAAEAQVAPDDTEGSTSADNGANAAEPPANEPPTPEEPEKGKPGYNFAETSIKNEVTTEERRQRFLDKVEIEAKRDFGDVFERGKAAVISGKIDPISLAENIIEDPRPLRAEESAALLYGRMQLYNAHRATMDSIEEAVASGNRAQEVQEHTRLAIIENNINNNDIASRKAGYEQGLGLAARKMMITQDYSFANQQQLYRVANAGMELPADVKMKLESLTKELEAARKQLEDHQNKKNDSLARALAKMKKEVEDEKFQNRKQKRQQTAEQIDKRIADRKSAIYDKIAKNRGLQSNLGGAIGDAAQRLIEITPDLAALAKDYIHAGINSVDGIVDQLHMDLKDHLEGISKRDIRDAISGYGKTSKLNDDPIEAQLREIKRQSRLISALEDAQNGERPLRSGLEREPPSEKVRELQKQVYRAMLENGIPINPKDVNPEDAWKSALESVKTRLKNQIDDLNKQLATGEKPEAKPAIKYDQEANDLKAERDRLKSAIEAINGKPEMAPEHAIAIAKGTLERSIAEYERRIKENDLNPQRPDSKTPETPELTALRERLAQLKESYKKLQDDAKPKITPEERALDAYKKRNEKKAQELQGKIDRGEFEVEPKKEPPVLDDDAKRLQARVNLLQRKIDEGRENLRYANRGKLEKALDWGAKYRKFVLLVDPTTVAKLGAAGAMRMVTTPLEEIAGHGLTMIPGLNKISSMAPREGGGVSLTAEARSLAEVLGRRSINEMYRTATKGKSELEERVDTDEKIHAPNGILDLPGQIHGALKTIPKQNEYYRSLQKRIEYALKNGYDISTPDTQTSIQVENFKSQYPDLFTGKSVPLSDLEYQAFNDSKRAIFMQDNLLSTKWQKMITATPKEGAKGQIIQFIGKVMLPIIKIPSNFVAESSSYALGAVKGMMALRNGIDNLSPDDADYVMRAFKKQSVGAGFFALGYFLPQYVGGFYTEKERRGWNDPEAGDILLFGHSVPHWLMHSPVLEVMQMGATVRRVHDQYQADANFGAPDEADKDVVKGGLALTKGLFGQVPLFGEPADVAHGMESADSWNKFSANFVLGLFEPYDVQRVVKAMDTDSQGNEIQRNPKGFTQNVEAGLPILRKNVPEK